MNQRTRATASERRREPVRKPLAAWDGGTAGEPQLKHRVDGR